MMSVVEPDMIIGSGNAANAQDVKLAVYLANREADTRDATTGKAREIAQGVVRGAARALNLAGYDARGTENAIIGDVLEWVRDNPRPSGSGYPTDRKRWTAKAETELAAILADHRRSA
jgi:hypothetical protein